MAHVVLTIILLVQHIQEYCRDNEEARVLVSDIEKFWERE